MSSGGIAVGGGAYVTSGATVTGGALTVTASSSTSADSLNVLVSKSGYTGNVILGQVAAGVFSANALTLLEGSNVLFQVRLPVQPVVVGPR